MKIKNLADYPQQLGDGRVVGASGTKQETREYDLPELAKEDKRRVRNGTLAVVEEVETKTLEKESYLESSAREKMPLVAAKNNDDGTKGKPNGGSK